MHFRMQWKLGLHARAPARHRHPVAFSGSVRQRGHARFPSIFPFHTPIFRFIGLLVSPRSFYLEKKKKRRKKRRKKKRKRQKAIREIREETMRWLLVKRPRFRTVSNGNNPFLVWRAASRKTFLSISERYGTINNTFVTRGELKTRDKRHTADFILRARHVRSICITTYRVTFTWTRVCVRADASVTVASYVLCRVYSNRRFIRRTEGVGRALFRKRVINVKAYSRIRISGFLLGPLSGG